MKLSYSSLVGSDSASVHFFEDCNQTLSTHAALILSHHHLIELESQSCTRHSKLHSATLVQNNAQVFDEVLDVEARLKVSFQHSWRHFLQLEAASTSLRQKTDHVFVVYSRLLGIEQRLTHSNQSRCNHNLIRSFGVLAGSCISHVLDFLRVDVQQWLCQSDTLFSTAYHSHQLSIKCPNVTSRNRSIDRVHAHCHSLLVDRLS